MKVVQPIRDQEIIYGIKVYLKLRSIRDFLLFCIGIYSGLRVSDLLSLRAISRLKWFWVYHNKAVVALIFEKWNKPLIALEKLMY